MDSLVTVCNEEHIAASHWSSCHARGALHQALLDFARTRYLCIISSPSSSFPSFSSPISFVADAGCAPAWRSLPGRSGAEGLHSSAPSPVARRCPAQGEQAHISPQSSDSVVARGSACCQVSLAGAVAPVDTFFQTHFVPSSTLRSDNLFLSSLFDNHVCISGEQPSGEIQCDGLFPGHVQVPAHISIASDECQAPLVAGGVQVLSLEHLVPAPGCCILQPTCFEVVVQRCSDSQVITNQPVKCGVDPQLDLRQVRHFFKASTAVVCDFALQDDWAPLFDDASLSKTWDQWWMLYYLLCAGQPWVSRAGPAEAHDYVDGSFFSRDACAGWGLAAVWQDGNGHCSFMGYAGSQLFEQDVSNMQCQRLDSSYAEAVAMLAALMLALTEAVTVVTVH